jgi:hypothetical protein
MKRFSFWFLILMLTLQVQAGVPEPVGVWEFNASDPLSATVGAPLEIVGSAQNIIGFDDEDGTISIGEGSYYICRHGIAPNGGGTKVNEWTLLIDFWYPASSLSDPPNGYNDLFQTDSTNADDSDWTINSSGGIGMGAVGYSSAFGFTTQAVTWYRMVLVVDNGTRQDLYIDGVEIFKGNQQGIDGRYSLADTLLLFAAGNNQDGDDATINVSTVAIWDVPLSANEIFTLGSVGDSVSPETIAPIVDVGVDQTVVLDVNSVAVVNLEGIITDEDDDEMTFAWQVISGRDDIVIEPTDSNTATATITAPGQYILQLSVNDGLYTATDEVMINAWVHDYNDLIVYWNFEEPWNGQDVNDASGNRNYGRIIDGLDGTSEYVPLETETGQGLNLLSDELTETGDWVELDSIMPVSGTIAMWVKPIYFYNYHSIFDNSGNANDWEMWIYGDSRARFRVESDTAVTANLNNLAEDGDGQNKWWHFACTWARDPNQPNQVATQLYVNGKLMDENAGSWVDPGTTFFLGGGHPDNDFCNSTFDDVMIYDKALPAEEILALVYPDNKPPVVEAGDEQTVWLSEEGSVSITLTGSVEDIDGSPVGEMTLLWEKVEGSDDIIIETPNAAETVVVINTPGLYTFSLTADDGQFKDTDEVVIDVWPFEDTGLIVHLPLDGNVDEVVAGFATKLIDGSQGNHEFVDGVIGQALQLSGSHDNTDNDVVSINFVYYQRGSICLWFKPTDLYNYNSILDNSVDGNDWEMWIYETGEFAGRIQSGYVRGYWMDVDTWYHIAMTWRPQENSPDMLDQLLYINGELVASNETEWVDPGTTVFLGGGHSGNDDCNGVFDDFRIYDRPITLEEIQQLVSQPAE